MVGRTLGVVVAGGRRPGLDPLVAADAALTPFAGKFRFIDFALATLANSGVHETYVLAPDPRGRLAARLARTAARATLTPLAALGDGSRSARLALALAHAAPLVDRHAADTLVVLSADHILQLDLRPLVAAHRAMAADATLAALPVGDGSTAPRLRIGADRSVAGVASGADEAAAALGWAGDLVVRGAALPALRAALAGATTDAEAIDALAAAGPLRAYDVVEAPLPADGRRTYWHEPVTLEAYYDAQMNLCTPRPSLDLYDPAWPLPGVVTGLPPAKVVADHAGRAGQALNALVSDGSVIRGGVVVNSVLGSGVVVESGAEVENSVLLDGCRIGAGAQVRRAIVGPGAVVRDGEAIGYGTPPSAPGRLAPSGLSVVVASSS